MIIRCEPQQPHRIDEAAEPPRAPSSREPPRAPSSGEPPRAPSSFPSAAHRSRAQGRQVAAARVQPYVDNAAGAALLADAAQSRSLRDAVAVVAHTGELKRFLIEELLLMRQQGAIDVNVAVAPVGVENDHLAVALVAEHLAMGHAAAVFFRDGDLGLHGVPWLMISSQKLMLHLSRGDFHLWDLSEVEAMRVQLRAAPPEPQEKVL